MRIFLAFMVFFMLGLVESVQAQEDSDIQWFEKLFTASKSYKTTEEDLRLLKSAKLVAHEEHDTRAEARAMIEMAAHHYTQLKDYGTALDWLIQSMIFEDSSGLKQEKIFTFIAMARVFEEVGEFQKSIEQLNRAQEVKGEDNLHLQILILSERGQVRATLGLTEEATSDYQQMLKYAQNGDLRTAEADALYHLGVLLGQKREYEEALKSHKAALAIRRELKDKTKEAESLNSVGQLYLHQQNYERSRANHVVALDIRKKLKDRTSLAESYNNIGSLYIAQKDYKQAINNLELALSNSQASEAQEQRLRAYEGLSLCYKELGDFKNALLNREQYSGIYDLIQLEKDKNKLTEVQNRYVIQEKESEIGQLAADMAERERVIEEQRKERNLLVLILALGVIIGGLILYLYLIIRKTNRKLKEINDTKDKLFSIIGHDLKGPLNSLTAFSSLLIHHAETLTQEEIKMLSGDVDKSLKNLFVLLENLLEWARSQTGNIDFKPTPFDLATVLQENCELLKGLAQKKNIALVNMGGTQLTVNAHRNSINTVVRNLISNAIKFTSEGGQIILTTEPAGNQLKVIVADNGVGMSKDALKRIFKLGTKHSTLGTSQEKGTGLGLILCKDFVEKNGGTIGVESEEGKGSRFYFTVPT
jgi:signal transduction histidine kinase